MTHDTAHRYFDLSTILALGLTAMLLVSLPGGCWSDDGEGEPGETPEALSEPTAIPTMAIVEPEPGDIDTANVTEDDGDDGEPADEEQEGNDEDEQEAEAPPNDGAYVVQEGDTLYGIAVQFQVTMDALMEANGIDDPNALQVGQELQIP